MLGRRKEKTEQLGRRRPIDRESSENSQRRVAFSYYANRSSDVQNVGRGQSSAVEDRQEQRSRLHAVLSHAPMIIASVVIILCVLNEFILSSSVKIVVLGVNTGASSIFLQDTSIYQKTASQLFRQSLANHNKLTVNVSAITGSLKQTFPELEDVSITLPILGHRPVVYINPSLPSFALSTTSGLFLLDNAGRALAQATSTAEVVKLGIAIVTDQSNLQPKIGQIALPSSDITFMNAVVSELLAQHITIREITLPPAASELDIYLAGTNMYGKFNMQQGTDGLQQVGTFIAVYKNLQASNKLPANYIDVRIDGRAYYK